MKGRIVIVAYQPKPGFENELDALTRNHYAILKEADLVSDRIPVIMKSQDGTVVEVFEWKSLDAIERAHSHPTILKLWEDYARVCNYVPVGQLPETDKLFSEFTPFE